MRTTPESRAFNSLPNSKGGPPPSSPFRSPCAARSATKKFPLGRKKTACALKIFSRKNFDFFRVAQIFSATLVFSVSKSLARFLGDDRNGGEGGSTEPASKKKLNASNFFAFVMPEKTQASRRSREPLRETVKRKKARLTFRASKRPAKCNLRRDHRRSRGTQQKPARKKKDGPNSSRPNPQERGSHSPRDAIISSAAFNASSRIPRATSVSSPSAAESRANSLSLKQT